MLVKKYKKISDIVFIKIPSNIGLCNGVCDYVDADNKYIRQCDGIIRKSCILANKYSYYNKYPYWIPKGHLLPKYKKYEN